MRTGFWNVSRNPAVLPLVAKLVSSKDLDLLVLAEGDFYDDQLLALLQFPGGEFTKILLPGCGKIRMFTRFGEELFRVVKEGNRYSVIEIKLPASPSFLLLAIHGQSLLHSEPESLDEEMCIVAEELRRCENELGHRRSIAVGDFNMDPFDRGISSARGFHAVMDRQIAKRLARTVQGNSYPFFYNPMWSHLGDLGGVPASYYHDSSGHLCQYWHLFDQLLIRPSILDWLPPGGESLVDEIDGHQLLDQNGRPNMALASDHLPLVFTLQIPVSEHVDE